MRDSNVIDCTELRVVHLGERDPVGQCVVVGAFDEIDYEDTKKATMGVQRVSWLLLTDHHREEFQGIGHLDRAATKVAARIHQLNGTAVC